MIKVRSAGAIIYFKEKEDLKFLLLQYKGKYWEFARGHIEKGESQKQAASREIKEETGLENLKYVSNFKTYSTWQYEDEGKLVDKKVTLFLVESMDQKVSISHEHIGNEWLIAEDALNRITFDNSKKAFKNALDFLKMKFD